MRTLKAAGAYFALVFAAGFALGTIRVPFLVPRLGERYAELLEMPLMLVAIVLSARHVVRRHALPSGWPPRLRVGLAALAMMVGAELLLATVPTGRSVGEYLATRDPVSGSVFVAMLMLFALMPGIVGRGRQGDGAAQRRGSGS